MDRPPRKKFKSRGKNFQDLNCLQFGLDALCSGAMKFFAAIGAFALFTFFISWGIVEMLKGSPWLLLASLAVFFGTFIKFGCLSH